MAYLFRIEFLLNAHLINSIFRRRGDESNKSRFPTNHFKYLFEILRKVSNYRKFKHLSRLGLRRIDRELDIVYFVRKSLV